MNEVWKAVKGYEGLYEISNTGKVKSLIKGRLLKPWEHKKGYKTELCRLHPCCEAQNVSCCHACIYRKCPSRCEKGTKK